MARSIGARKIPLQSRAEFLSDEMDSLGQAALVRQPHHCHARGCERAVPPKMLMCYPHWRMVPRLVQRKVWATYRDGQEITKDPSREYLAAAREAIEAVAFIEAHAKI